MNALAIRQLDDGLFQQLKSEALARKTSVNKLVLSLLREALSKPANAVTLAEQEALAQKVREERTQWILSLAPQWTEQEHKEFEDAIAPFSEIDAEMWD